EPDRHPDPATARHRPPGRHRLLHGQRPGVVRHHRLRLVRRGDQPAVLPGGGRGHGAALHLRRLRHVVPDPPARRPGARLLLRPVGPQGSADADHRHHDRRHGDHGLRPDGRHDRRGRRARDPGVPAAAGLLRRRGVRDRDHLPGGERPAPQGVLRLLAGGDAGLGDAAGVGLRLRAQLLPDHRPARRLGVAHPVLLRPADRARRALHPAEDGRDPGVRRHRAGQVAGGADPRGPHGPGAQRGRRRRPGLDLGLPDPLHAHLRRQQPRAAPLRRLPRRDHQRPGQLRRRPLRGPAGRPGRAAADHAARGRGLAGARAAAVPRAGGQPVGAGADPGPGGAGHPDGLLLRPGTRPAVLHVPDRDPHDGAVDLLQPRRDPVRRLRPHRAHLADQRQRQPAVAELLLHGRGRRLDPRPARDPQPRVRDPGRRVDPAAASHPGCL
ncbi:MAG: Uncharacterized MFS-type transporter, partial [uncultured Friedmanniella sp.]